MIELEGVSVEQGQFALRDVSFTVPEGGYGVLVGKSGCGKTTLLEVICGLRPVATGRVRLAGRDVTTLRPGERGVGYVPQDAALFPHQTVKENLAFGLVVRRRPDVAARVAELAELLGLGALLERGVGALSGGEAQRVALGRALAPRPAVLCLDEPLSALDEETHDELCGLLEEVHRETQVTVLHVGHKLSEVRRLGNPIFRCADGQVRLDEGSP